MPRFRSHGQLDDPFVEDGDPAFRGLDQQSEPVLLQAGFLQIAENVRIDQGVITSRKGLEALKTVADAKALVKFLDPINNREDMLIITATGILGNGYTDIPSSLDRNEGAWQNANYNWSDYANINETLDSAFSSNDEVFGIQAFNQVILFSKDRRPKVWDGVPNTRVSDLPLLPTSGIAEAFACPDAPFGMYFANRLVVPFYADSPSTVAFSDILDSNSFMNINTFFCNKGTSDITLGFAPFMESQVLVLNQESIHIVNAVHALEGNSASYEITRQYGIAGHRAFAQNGSYTYFVSSEGNIQVLVPSSDPAKGVGLAISKVTLDQEPLSKPITPFMETVNLDAIDKAIVKYHRNRVYFALPVSSERPNCIAIYNSLNSVWESIDFFEDENFEIMDINTLGPDLFILTKTQLFKYNSSSTDDGNLIKSRVRTRDYALQMRDLKKFVRGSLNYSSDGDSSITIKVHTKAPDVTVLSKKTTGTGSVNTLSRFNIRQRGYSASVDIENAGGDVEYKAVSLEAFVHGGRGTADYGN
tara:strand:- start:5371 stop:6963 length:1593 start_codon:yes stop_codon:yes gene_type:complete